MIAIYIILGLVALLCGLYFLVFIRPQAKLPENKRLLCPYAHRGLHGKEIPENSTAVGIPAKVVRRDGEKVKPAEELDQVHVPDPVYQEIARLERKIKKLEQQLKEKQ